MFFKIKKGTKTHKELLDISETGFDAVAKVNKFLENLQKEHPGVTTKYRPAYWSIWGGISSIVFDENPDRKIWKKVRDGEFYPKKNNKVGRKIAKEIEELPVITSFKLNGLIGYDGIHTAGIKIGEDDNVGLDIGDDWDFEPNDDMVEILKSEYEKL